MATLVNAWLTQTQRDYLTDSYLNHMVQIDMAEYIDDAKAELDSMPNPEFYAECLNEMPDSMNELRRLGIR